MLKTQKQIEEEFEKFYAYAMGVSGPLRLEALLDFIHAIRESDREEVVKGLDDYIEMHIEDKKFNRQWFRTHVENFLSTFGITNK